MSQISLRCARSCKNPCTREGTPGILGTPGAEGTGEGEVALRESQGLKLKELSRAQELAEENRAIIIEKWHEHIG